ncbi:MAG: stage II sporulation protein M [Bacillota bacterium]
MGIQRLKEEIRYFFKKNCVFFFIILVVFLMGVFFGALSLKTLNAMQKKELVLYLESFFQGFKQKAVSGLPLVRLSLFNNLKTIGLIWLFGLTVIGVPLILLLIFTRGFIFGFTVGFLVEEYTFKGFIFSLLAIVPHNLVIFPVLFLVSIMSIDLAGILLRQRSGQRPARLGNVFAGNVAGLAAAGIVLIGASFLEAYVSPFFISLLSGIMR